METNTTKKKMKLKIQKRTVKIHFYLMKIIDMYPVMKIYKNRILLI